ncbi:MAG: lipoprotein NlpI [Methanosaeta sp. PtaU1.Bin112]|nr:MAG: lipoprotein NlpI [Methanosaeta sp. PtaU1.Bin112]
MIKVSCLAAMMLLIVGSLMLPASSQEQVSQTVYVYEGDFNGTALSGVQVVGQDAAGKSFSGTTDANGIAVVSGQAGEWLFVFIKDGYETLDLNYNVSETGEGAVYLVKSNQNMVQNVLSQSSQQPEAMPQGDAAGQTQLNASETGSENAGKAELERTKSSQNEGKPAGDSLTQSALSQHQVSESVYVYDGDFNGSLLSGVKIAGQDAVGKSFSGITDSNGVAVLSGQAGEWLFEFEKDGYETLKLRYNVTDTGEGAVYLARSKAVQSKEARSDKPSEQAVPNSDNQQEVSNANGTDERQSVEYWLLMGNSLYEQGRYDEAAESYDRCILLNSQIEAAWFNKGNAHYMQGDFDNALSAFDKAIEINPKDANAWICRGLTLKKLGRNTEANSAFIQAKELGYTG